MYAKFTCEGCYESYDSEYAFVRCHGDACQEDICKKLCAKKCRNPPCTSFICENCADSLKGYCIDHAYWNEANEIVDYVAQGLNYQQFRQTQEPGA